MSDLSPREIRAIYEPPTAPGPSRLTRLVSWGLLLFAYGFIAYAFVQAVILWRAR